jgi:hypothetical protein
VTIHLEANKELINKVFVFLNIISTTDYKMIDKRILLTVLLSSVLVTSPAVLALDKLEVGAVVEVEYSSITNYDNTEESGFALATVEFGINAQLNDFVDFHILVLHEDGNTEPWEVDEATVAMYDREKMFNLTAGRLYVPFGNYDSNMISDPLTLELGETREAAIQVGVDYASVSASVFSFNGETIEAEDVVAGKDKADQYGYALSYAFEADRFNLNAGVSYINSIAESGGIFDNLTSATAVPELVEYVAGNSAFVVVGYGPVKLITEKIAAKDEFDVAELPWLVTQGAQPKASNTELSLSFPVLGKEVVISVGQQITAEALALELPEKRSIAAIGVSLFGNVSLTIERLTDTDYAIADGGTGDKARATTVQILAAKF